MADPNKPKPKVDSAPEEDKNKSDTGKTEKADPEIDESGDEKKLEKDTNKVADEANKKAGDDSETATEDVNAADLETAKIDFDVAVNEMSLSPEAALDQVNKGGDKFKLNAERNGIELNTADDSSVEVPVPGAPEDDEATDESAEKVTETLSKSDQEFIDATIKQMTEELGMTSENAKDLAMALLPIHRAIQSFKNGPEGDSTEAPDEKSGDKTDEKPDEKAGDDKTEKGGDASGETVDESTEEVDETTVQNPKEEADKIRASAESLQSDRADLEAQVSKLEDEGVSSDETDPMIELVGKIKAIDEKIATIEAKAVPFDEELERRANIVDTTWQNASEGSEDGLISGVTLDTADGDNLLISVKDPAMAATVTAVAESFGTGVSVDGAGNIVLEDVPHGQITEEGPLNALMDALAAIPAPAVSDDAEDEGDLDESKEAAPESIEKMVESLNAKRIDLIESNEQFMTEAPIGKVFAEMEYRVAEDGKNITIHIPASASAEYRSIMLANGRKVEGEVPNYTVAYPGETIAMGEQGGNYPSRLAWGGTEGDAKSQFASAEAGMSMWQSSVTTEVPDDTQIVAAEDNADINLSEELSPAADKVGKALDSLRGSLGDAVGETPFGKFIDSLDVKSVDGNIALTSSLDAQTFSHMYKELNLSASITGTLETHGGDGYVMQFEEGKAENLVHNLGRWAAMMGSKTESKFKGGGDLGDGTEVAKGEKGPEVGNEGDLNAPPEDGEGAPEKIDIPKLRRFAEDLNKRRDTLQYSVEVSVDEEAGRILITAIDNEWGTAAVEGAAQLISIQAESEPRMMSATYTESGALSLDIRTKHEQHGYLGDITGEEFGEKPEADVEAPTLGGDGTEDSETSNEDSEKIKEAKEKAVKDISKDVEKIRDHLQTDTGDSYLNEDGSIADISLKEMLSDINVKINKSDPQITDADLIKTFTDEGLFDPILTGSDQGSQIYMDENGIGVERIKPEAPTTPTPTPPSTDINNSVDGIDTSNVENIA